VCAPSLRVAYPARAGGGEVRRALDHLAGARTDAVRRRMWWNVAVMPLILPLMLTPVGPGAWGELRVYKVQGGALRVPLSLTTECGPVYAASGIHWPRARLSHGVSHVRNTFHGCASRMRLPRQCFKPVEPLP
jgi:hypothetical protein